MKTLLCGALALSFLAAGTSFAQGLSPSQDQVVSRSAGLADASSQTDRHHRICGWRHHHRVCRWVR